MTKAELGKIVQMEQFNGSPEQINKYSIGVFPSMLIDQFSDPDDENNWSEEQYRINTVGNTKTSLRIGDWIATDTNSNYCVCRIGDNILLTIMNLDNLEPEKLPAVVELYQERKKLKEDYLKSANKALYQNNLPTEDNYYDARTTIEENDLEEEVKIEDFESWSDYDNAVDTNYCEILTAKKVFSQIMELRE